MSEKTDCLKVRWLTKEKTKCIANLLCAAFSWHVHKVPVPKYTKNPREKALQLNDNRSNSPLSYSTAISLSLGSRLRLTEVALA